MHVVLLYFVIFVLIGLLAGSAFSIRALLVKSDYYENLFLSLIEESESYIRTLKNLSESSILYDNDEVKTLVRSTDDFINYLEAYEWDKKEEE